MKIKHIATNNQEDEDGYKAESSNSIRPKSSKRNSSLKDESPIGSKKANRDSWVLNPRPLAPVDRIR